MAIYQFYNDQEWQTLDLHLFMHTFNNHQEMMTYLQKLGRRPLKIIPRDNHVFDVVVSRKGILEKWFNMAAYF